MGEATRIGGLSARLLVPALAFAAAALVLGCDERPLAPQADAGAEATGGLSPDQASRVVAKVGDRTFTLGDFAQSLERMNEFDRLRYQTKERRRELLSDMIDVELLVQEAKRRGIDKRPDVQDAIRQVLRDAMLARARGDLPAPAEIPADEVRAYFEANPDKFTEPERRRVSAIVMDDRNEAEKTLKEALALKTAGEWGDLFGKRSTTAKKDPHGAVDLAGDLGIVGPASDSRGANRSVPEPVRAAVFEIGAVGAVADKVIEADGHFYIVRMSGKTEGHSRTLAESDRSIRVALLQKKLQEKEQALDEELRRKFPVEIDERALASVTLPGAAQALDAASKASPSYPAASASTPVVAPDLDEPPQGALPEVPGAPKEQR